MLAVRRGMMLEKAEAEEGSWSGIDTRPDWPGGCESSETEAAGGHKARISPSSSAESRGGGEPRSARVDDGRGAPGKCWPIWGGEPFKCCLTLGHCCRSCPYPEIDVSQQSRADQPKVPRTVELPEMMMSCCQRSLDSFDAA